MDTPGAVIAARLIGWLQAIFALVLGFAGWVLESSWGDFGVKVGAITFLIFVLIACYFAIPQLFLQRGQPGGRNAVMIVEGLAAAFWLSVYVDTSDSGALPFLFGCAAVVVLLALPSAARWSNPPRPILVPSPLQYQVPAGPWTNAREAAANPFVFHNATPPAYPALPPPGAYVPEPAPQPLDASGWVAPTGPPPPAGPPTGPPTAPPPGLPPGPPPPPTVPPGYRWQPPNYRDPGRR